MRLNKRLSELGVCSRREADKLIAAGIDPYVRSFADAVYGDIEARNTVWSRRPCHRQ